MKNSEPSRNEGSSPHTRGAQARLHVLSVPRRIIPAYAGSTLAIALPYLRLKDHPRIRGEHASHNTDNVHDKGSSPHTRGAPDRLRDGAGGGGIIPAYAGSTGCSAGRRTGRWDHPRIRGEHGTVPPAVALRVGSSPHTRGAHGRGVDPAVRQRIIPAYAGSTFCAILKLRSPIGSSPHTRGALPPPIQGGGSDGIIPAYAGSTSAVSSGCGTMRDHPRIRGEHSHASQPSY